MSWGQWIATLGLVMVANACSLAVIFSVTSWVSDRRKRKIVEPMLRKFEESLETDIEFMDLVSRLELDDDDDDD